MVAPEKGKMLKINCAQGDIQEVLAEIVAMKIPYCPLCEELLAFQGCNVIGMTTEQLWEMKRDYSISIMA